MNDKDPYREVFDSDVIEGEMRDGWLTTNVEGKIRPVKERFRNYISQSDGKDGGSQDGGLTHQNGNGGEVTGCSELDQEQGPGSIQEYHSTAAHREHPHWPNRSSGIEFYIRFRSLLRKHGMGAAQDKVLVQNAVPKAADGIYIWQDRLSAYKHIHRKALVFFNEGWKLNVNGVVSRCDFQFEWKDGWGLKPDQPMLWYSKSRRRWCEVQMQPANPADTLRILQQHMPFMHEFAMVALPWRADYTPRAPQELFVYQTLEFVRIFSGR